MINYLRWEDDEGNREAPPSYARWEGWVRGFDKEHLRFYETEPPRPLPELIHGYEYLILDESEDSHMFVAVWNSATGWEGECPAAKPSQWIACLPEPPVKEDAK
jgi:hypothetical protein